MARRETEERGSRYASARKRAETHSTGERTSFAVPEGMKTFQLKKPGIYRLDILPYTVGKGNPYAEPGAKYYERTYFVHRGIGPNQDTYVCPQKTWKKRCPICEQAAKMRTDPDHDEDTLKSLWPKERQLFLILDHDDKEAGVQLWDMSFHLFGKQLDAEINNSDNEDNFEKFFHAGTEGMTLKIGAEEKSFAGQKFCEVTTIHFKSRTEPLDTSLLKGLPCLDDLPKAVEYEKLKAIFLQMADADEGEDEDAPKKRSSKDDDDDDDPQPKSSHRKQEDDDDDPPPKSSGKKKAKPKDDDEDEDDDQPFDDDDDDDDDDD